MFKYLLKRLSSAIISMFIVVTVVFLLMRLMPVEGYFGGRADSMTEENKQKILQNMGLLDPWYKQLLNFYDDLVHLDFGRSVTLQSKTPVVKILAKKLPYSVNFGLGAIVISLLLGCSLGVLMARRKGGFWDKIGTGYIVIINAVPAHCLLSDDSDFRYGVHTSPHVVQREQARQLHPPAGLHGTRTDRELCHVDSPLYGG